MAYDNGRIERHTSKLLEDASKSIAKFVHNEIEDLETRNSHLSRQNDDLRKELFEYNVRINNLTKQLGFQSLAEAEESFQEDPAPTADNSNRVNVDLYNRYMTVAEQRVVLQEDVTRLTAENNQLKDAMFQVQRERKEESEATSIRIAALDIAESLKTKNEELEARLEKELLVYEKNSKRKDAAMVALQDRIRHLEEQASGRPDEITTSGVNPDAHTSSKPDKENSVVAPLNNTTNSPTPRPPLPLPDKPYHDASYEGLKTVHRLLMDKYDALRAAHTTRNKEYDDVKIIWDQRFREMANKLVESSKRVLKKLHGEKMNGTDEGGSTGEIILQKFMESWHEAFRDLIEKSGVPREDVFLKPKDPEKEGRAHLGERVGVPDTSRESIADEEDAILPPRNLQSTMDHLPITTPTRPVVASIPPPSPTESDSPFSQPLVAKLRQLQDAPEGSPAPHKTPQRRVTRVEELDDPLVVPGVRGLPLFSAAGSQNWDEIIGNSSPAQPEAGPSRYAPRPPSKVIQGRFTRNSHFTPKGHSEIPLSQKRLSTTSSTADDMTEDLDVPFSRPPPSPKGKEKEHIEVLQQPITRSRSSPPDSPTKRTVLGKRKSPTRSPTEDEDDAPPGSPMGRVKLVNSDLGRLEGPHGSKEEKERYYQDLKKKPHAEYVQGYAQYKGRGRYAQSSTNAKQTIGAQFEINRDRNDGVDFQYDAVVRNRAQRKKMDAGDCEECQEYYNAVGYLEPIERGPRWRSPTPSGPSSAKRPRCRQHGHDDDQAIRRSASDSMVDTSSPDRQDQIQEHRKNISRHRHDWARAKTPPDYWHIGFPSTQQIEDINRRADVNHQAKLREIERESNKKDGKYKKR